MWIVIFLGIFTRNMRAYKNFKDIRMIKPFSLLLVKKKVNYVLLSWFAMFIKQRQYSMLSKQDAVAPLQRKGQYFQSCFNVDITY